KQGSARRDEPDLERAGGGVGPGDRGLDTSATHLTRRPGFPDSIAGAGPARLGSRPQVLGPIRARYQSDGWTTAVVGNRRAGASSYRPLLVPRRRGPADWLEELES